MNPFIKFDKAFEKSQKQEDLNQQNAKSEWKVAEYIVQGLIFFLVTVVHP